MEEPVVGPVVEVLAPRGRWQAEGVVEVLSLRREEAARPFGRHRTDRGTWVQLALPRGQQLEDGDLIWQGEGRAIAVRVEMPPVVEIGFPNGWADGPEARRAVELAWALGNQHLPMRVDERGRFRVPVYSPSSLLAWLARRGFTEVVAREVAGEQDDPLPNPQAHQGRD
ncbi:MAG: urease accessory protein UreE [Firmicutes bacterium]|nr:urease accessory protein UreE [Bacillota bacterium]